MTSHTFLRIVLYTMAAATLNGCAESPAPVPPAGQKADSVQAYILKADTVSRSVAIPGELKPFLQPTWPPKCKDMSGRCGWISVHGCVPASCWR